MEMVSLEPYDLKVSVEDICSRVSALSVISSGIFPSWFSK